LTRLLKASTNGIDAEALGSWRGFQETDQGTNCQATQRNHRRTKSNRPPAEDHDVRFLAESARHNTSSVPSEGLSEMPLNHTLSGRMERRLPIVVVVRLARAERAGVDGEERTYTDNISSRGARVYSIRPWQLGDAVQVTPRNEDPACGNVVYCQTLEDGRFVIGVKFPDRPTTWSVVRRYDGLQSGGPIKSEPS
jgi:hypothetical protein